MPACRVSVVIPACNSERWLPETLASVCAQTFPHDQLEVIVVDDGSTDRTGAAASDILRTSDIAATTLRHPASRGPSAARNTGWRHARGEWIQFLDADDLLARDKIARQIEGAGVDAGEQVAVVYSPWGRLTRAGDAWRAEAAIAQPHLGDDAIAGLLGARNFIQVGAQLVRRDWLARVDGFDEQRRLIEDVQLDLRMAMAGGQLVHVESAAPLLWYRQVDDSLSRESSQAFVDGCLANAEMVEQFWTSRHELTPARRRVLAEAYCFGARYFAGRDRDRFHQLAMHLEALVPAFRPDSPWRLRQLSALMGYERAERVAGWYRRAKSTLVPARSGRGL